MSLFAIKPRLLKGDPAAVKDFQAISIKGDDVALDDDGREVLIAHMINYLRGKNGWSDPEKGGRDEAARAVSNSSFVKELIKLVYNAEMAEDKKAIQQKTHVPATATPKA